MQAESSAHVEAFIGLGSNLGDRRARLDEAVVSVGALPGVDVLETSAWIETDPVGMIDQPRFLNGVVRIRASCSARKLLDDLLEIERIAGRERQRGDRWGPRVLDLDLLAFGSCIIREPGLTVPHPRLDERRFVLEPLAELAPKLVLPGRSQTVSQLYEALIRSEAGQPGDPECV